MVEPNPTADPQPEGHGATPTDQVPEAKVPSRRELREERMKLPCFSIGLKQHQSGAAMASLARFRRPEEEHPKE